MVNDINGGMNLSIIVGSIDIATIQRVLEIRNARPSIVRHVFNIHWNIGGSRVVLLETFNQVQICAD